MIFFINQTATTESYTLSLHDALPISEGVDLEAASRALDEGLGNLHLFDSTRTKLGVSRKSIVEAEAILGELEARLNQDRKSTRLNSSHGYISYAVFCLKKKNKN